MAGFEEEEPSGGVREDGREGERLTRSKIGERSTTKS